MAKSRAQISADYRAKNLEEYRKRKREYAKTPEQREKRRAYMEKYRAENRQKTNEQARISHAKARKVRCPEKAHDQHLRYTYGIDRARYLAMLERQHGRCAICGSETARWKKRFHVDHCHVSGRIRGLLCNRCNPMLGWLEAYKTQIADYLEKSQAPKLHED